MSIPLDRLYNHIDRLSQSHCGDCLVIYRFSPHGSKKLNDLTTLNHTLESKNWVQWQTSPLMICHDQEPLKYGLYHNELIKNYTLEKYSGNKNSRYLVDMISNLHLRAVTYYPLSCYDLTLLTHSEKNSKELIKYQDHGFVGVYWWSHAVIARDWFRYAENIRQQKKVSRKFLIYNRAWAGSREYRLKFAEYLITNNLVHECLTKLNPRDPEFGIHYDQYQFENIIWKPNCILEDYFEANSADSHSSADFELLDYESSEIEVVLETLFDDERLHLTEKTLRPIALAQPFILAGTPGSLNYLKSYGFKTFESVWDESYDQIKDPNLRLLAITQLMKTISDWDSSTFKQKMQQAQQIANYNKQLFFSKSWQDSIFEEYQTNFESAWKVMKQNRTGKYFIQLRELGKIDKDWGNILDSDLPWRTREDVQQVADWIKNPR